MAGEQLLAENGLSGFTLRACARLAGVSHAAPKHHFGDVQGFLTAIAARGYQKLTEMLRDAIAAAESPEEEFVATSRAYLQFAEQHPEHFRIMFRCDLLNMANNRLHFEVGTTLTELTNVVQRQRGEREISIEELIDHVPRTASLVEDIVISWCHIHGLAHLRIEQQLGMIPADRFEEITAKVARRVSRLVSQHQQQDAPTAG